LTTHWVEKDVGLLRMLARRFGELCATPTSPLTAVSTTSRQLHDVLAAPLLHRLGPRRTVVIEADEILSAVPFQALLDSAGPYLVDQRDVVYSSGVHELARLRTSEARFSPREAALVVANPLGDASAGLPSLSDADREGTDVAHRFLGFQLLTD